MKSNEERLQDLLAYVDSLTRVHPSEIPGIDLYMDQVTTFMDSHLNTSKWLGEDKILTKTMINNYAKNNLLPPPVKKRYSKNHLLMLILIYYFKNVISFRDIEQLFSPISRAPLFPWFQPGIRRALQRNLFAGKRAAQALAGRRHGKI